MSTTSLIQAAEYRHPIDPVWCRIYRLLGEFLDGPSYERITAKRSGKRHMLSRGPTLQLCGKAGGQILVLCSVDVIGLFYDDVLKIREQVKLQTPKVSHLIVASTHVHEGPDTLGLWGPDLLHTGIDEVYIDWLDSQIATSAVRAANSLEPARVELSRDDHPLLGMLQSVDRPPIIKDPYLFVLRLTSVSAGAPIAVLVNWSDHPETLGGENTEITADYPHWLCEYLENHLGGTAVFFNGSIGKVSTLGAQVVPPDPATGEIAQDHRPGRIQGSLQPGSLQGRLAVPELRRIRKPTGSSYPVEKQARP